MLVIWRTGFVRGWCLHDDTTRVSQNARPWRTTCHRYFMHGLGHSLGLGVHDLAPVNGPFEPGWVLTVEPGIYIPDEGMGVRLENDILVTEAGPVDLCRHVPIDPDEIEQIMAG
jgi:Xaa-Pro aminopeptidase